jgi:hypothetical protein
VKHNEKNSILFSSIPFDKIHEPQSLIDYMLDKRKFYLINDYDMFIAYELNEIEDWFDELYFSILLASTKNKRNI